MEGKRQEAAAPFPKEKREVVERMFGKESSEENQLKGGLEKCFPFLCANISVFLAEADHQEKGVCPSCGKILRDKSGLCDCSRGTRRAIAAARLGWAEAVAGGAARKADRVSSPARFFWGNGVRTTGRAFSLRVPGEKFSPSLRPVPDFFGNHKS
ncbi:hypothetical protein E2320_014256 [Naja naja]|nr:hypothetical protein E2320_014256 [Naja naja]